MIPKEFYLFGQKIRVVKRRSLGKRGIRGYWNAPKNLIELQMNTKDHPCTKEQMEQTFFHELVHAILDHLQYTEISKNEPFVDRLGSAFHQYLKTAK